MDLTSSFSPASPTHRPALLPSPSSMELCAAEITCPLFCTHKVARCPEGVTTLARNWFSRNYSVCRWTKIIDSYKDGCLCALCLLTYGCSGCTVSLSFWPHITVCPLPLASHLGIPPKFYPQPAPCGTHWLDRFSPELCSQNRDHSSGYSICTFIPIFTVHQLKAKYVVSISKKFIEGEGSHECN